MYIRKELIDSFSITDLEIYHPVDDINNASRCIVNLLKLLS